MIITVNFCQAIDRILKMWQNKSGNIKISIKIMPVLKRQKGQISIGELEEKIANGTASRKEQEEFKEFEQAVQPLISNFRKIENSGKV